MTPKPKTKKPVSRKDLKTEFVTTFYYDRALQERIEYVDTLCSEIFGMKFNKSDFFRKSIAEAVERFIKDLETLNQLKEADPNG